MARIPLEIVIIGFDDLPVDAAQAVVDRMDATGQVRIVSATVARREADGSMAAEEWSYPRDLADVVADLAARQFLGIDGMIGTDLAEALQPGETVLLLVVQHLWLQSVYADVHALGGRDLASYVVPSERIVCTERQLWSDGP